MEGECRVAPGRQMLQRVIGAARHIGELYRLELPERGQVRKRDIERFLPSAPVVVEVGAHVGTDTAAMARRWRDGEIHAFEPVPALYRRLKAKVRRFDNVRTYQLALAARSAETVMHVSGGRSDASSSILRPDEHLAVHPEVTFDQTITVHAVTLDEWSTDNAVTPDLLWLDAQGAELQILASGTSTLGSVAAIYTEVSIRRNYAGGVLYPELVSWLRGQGFIPAMERIAWADGSHGPTVETCSSPDSANRLPGPVSPVDRGDALREPEHPLMPDLGVRKEGPHVAEGRHPNLPEEFGARLWVGPREPPPRSEVPQQPQLHPLGKPVHERGEQVRFDEEALVGRLDEVGPPDPPALVSELLLSLTRVEMFDQRVAEDDVEGSVREWEPTGIGHDIAVSVVDALGRVEVHEDEPGELRS
jgi:FkbM family methyltransferase